MKCPTCGLECDSEVVVEDLFLCRVWAYLYLMTKVLPTEEQFNAMQRVGLLPLCAPMSDGSGKTYELNHGHYGYGIMHDWPTIAAKTLAANVVKP